MSATTIADAIQEMISDPAQTRILGRSFGTDPITIAGATLTLTDEHHARILLFTNTSGCTVTIPTGLRDGFSLSWSQNAAGKVVFVAVSGVILRAFDNGDRSAGQYATGGLAAIDEEVYRLLGQLQTGA